jgi:tetratricopeptide (TPR) repeat protein
MHPLNTWSVVWIPARGDLLLTLFAILSFICYINFLKKNKMWDLLLTVLFFTLALFSKETAAFIPFLFLIYFIYNNFNDAKGASQKNLPVRKNLKCLIPKINNKHLLLASLMAVMGSFWYYLRHLAIIHIDDFFIFNDFVYNLQNITTVFSQILFPYEISPFPKFTWIKLILGSLVLIGLVYLFLKKTRISRWEKIFIVSWFLLFLFPVLFIRLKNIDYFEHRYLLPQIGIFILLIKQIAPKNNQTVSTFFNPLSHKIIILFILPIFCITSFVKARTLQNPVSIADAAEEYGGLCFYPHLNRGVYYMFSENYTKAIHDFNKVINLEPNHSGTIINLAYINLKLQNYESANELYSMALLVEKKDYKLYENRAQAKMGLGDFSGALHDIDSAIMLNKNLYLLHNNRGILKMNLKLYENVIADFEEAKRLSNFSNIDVLSNCAAVKYQFGEYVTALQDCDMALKLEPNNQTLLSLKEAIINDQTNSKP